MAVAVVVGPVADFRCSGMSCRIIVIAVGVQRGKAGRAFAGGDGPIRLTKIISVLIGIESGQDPFVDFLVAVVILFIADLECSRVNV